MLNIISRSIISTHTRGPRKVVLNLVKGLEELGYPYVINADLKATKTLWIHDDSEALIKASKLPSDYSIVAGPNIYTLPSEVPIDTKKDNVLFLHPATWVQEFWNENSLDKLKSTVWPAGIDTELFRPDKALNNDLIIVYNKQRSGLDTEFVCRALEEQKERFQVLNYGQYKESEYMGLLRQAKAIIWIGRSESQGIGLLEALSMNVPMLVWDISKFGDFINSEKSNFSHKQLQFPSATSAPYFDQRCGLIFKHKEDLGKTLTEFLKNLNFYQPRAFVLSKLSLKKQSQSLIDLYKINFSVTEEDLRNNFLLTNKKWRNGRFCFYLYTKIKDAVKQIIR